MKMHKFFITALAFITGLALSGCGNTQDTETEIAAAAANGGSILDTADLFTERDLAQTADLTDSTILALSDGEDITISEEGIYVITGSATNSTIAVDAGNDAKVQLVLDGISITNADAPAIYVISADKCFITLTDNESTLSVTGEFAANGDVNTDAVIFSKDDIVLNGTGTLNICSESGGGINSKDDVKVTGGTYNISVSENGIEANDRIAICDGAFTISSQKDAIHCKNSDDAALGWVYISGGTFGLDAANDGIEGMSVVEIDGGSLDISGREGIEATYVQINGGTITINASDDGINASDKSQAYESAVEFNDGEIYITVGQGDTDAVDSNGTIIINGGTINVTAPVSSFDYNTTAEFNGGTVIINGTEVTELPQSMGGGPGGMGGPRGMGGERPQDDPPEGGGHRGGTGGYRGGPLKEMPHGERPVGGGMTGDEQNN